MSCVNPGTLLFKANPQRSASQWILSLYVTPKVHSHSVGVSGNIIMYILHIQISFYNGGWLVCVFLYFFISKNPGETLLSLWPS